MLPQPRVRWRRWALAWAAAVVVLVAVAVVVPMLAPPTTIRLAGSTTLGDDLVPDLAVAFLTDRGATGVTRTSESNRTVVVGTLPGADRPVRFEITPTGTNAAFDPNVDSDIGMASRKITADEARDLKPSRGMLEDVHSEYNVALDGVAVVVNRGLGVSALTVDQLQQIFTCQVRDWSQVGGRPGPITVYARDSASGTFETFREKILGDAPLCPGAVQLTDSRQEEDAVEKDAGGVGIVGFPFVKGTTALAIGVPGSAPVAPSTANISRLDYYLARRLYLYLSTPPREQVAQDFADFTITEAGQKTVIDDGFVPAVYDATVYNGGTGEGSPVVAGPPPPPVTPCTGPPAEYCSLVAGAGRLPFELRFQSGADALDTSAVRDVDGFVAYYRSPGPDGLDGKGRVLLVGFADSQGDPAANAALSQRRAAVAAADLAREGITNVETASFGEQRPVAPNTTEDGRSTNRRVEVWVR